MTETINIYEHDFECICGNNSHGQGGYSSDLRGNEIDPPPSDDDPCYWCCDKCGRIWDGQTGHVVSTREIGYTYKS